MSHDRDPTLRVLLRLRPARLPLARLARQVKPGAIAVSLAKGMDVRPEGPQLISQMVRRILGIDCSVLMGANIAADIANEQYSEAVIG